MSSGKILINHLLLSSGDDRMKIVLSLYFLIAAFSLISADDVLEDAYLDVVSLQDA